MKSFFVLINITAVAATVLYSATALAATTEHVCPSTEQFWASEAVYAGNPYQTLDDAKLACTNDLLRGDDFDKFTTECLREGCTYSKDWGWHIGEEPKGWVVGSCDVIVDCHHKE